jgi:hypothetical protein
MRTTPTLAAAARAVALALVVAALPAVAAAGDKEFDAVVRHIQTQYHAKKQDSLPFIARVALKFVHPAGVKSFKLTTLEQISGASGDAGLGAVVREKLSDDWHPLVRIYSRKEREQTYVYMRESGRDVELFVVTVDDEQATVVKAKLDVDSLADFVADAHWNDHGDDTH